MHDVSLKQIILSDHLILYLQSASELLYEWLINIRFSLKFKKKDILTEYINCKDQKHKPVLSKLILECINKV